MDLRHRVCVCGKKRQAGLRALDSTAKLPMQSRAVEASNRLLHVIWMRLEAPCRPVRGPVPCLDLTLSLFPMPVMELTLQAILAR